ncbi:hypothetical protein N1851_032778 [Merluccius polli]|uniref:Uncharacterized protein n=1 Tax=Merluccius polli TaxID=89951 RepID=A0AA47M2B7_MERPO|nr:hypothetical protein N1851_032778 [Merluccius polli]
MKAVQEDEELLCIVWAKTGAVSGHTILRNGSTHCYIAPTLSWDIHRGPVANNITATSSALGQVEASFIHKHEDVQHKDDLNMKTQLGLLCFAVVTSLAKAELGAPRLPAPIAEHFRFPLDNYRPLLDQLNIATDYAENESLSTVAVSSVTFPSRETDCGEVDTSVPGWRCPLKENGKLLLCSARVSFTTQDDEVQGFKLSCDAEVKEESLMAWRLISAEENSESSVLLRSRVSLLDMLWT